MTQFTVTAHCIERLKERFVEQMKYPEWLHWKKGESTNVFYSFFDLVLKESSELKALLNDVPHMMPYYEKYGYDAKISFHENEQYQMIVVMVQAANMQKPSIVTVLPTNFRLKPKKQEYKKIKEVKEVREQMQILNQYQNLVPVTSDNSFLKDIEIKEMLITSVIASEAVALNTLNRYIYFKDGMRYTFDYHFTESSFKLVSAKKNTPDFLCEPKHTFERKIFEQYIAGDAVKFSIFGKNKVLFKATIKQKEYYFIVHPKSLKVQVHNMTPLTDEKMHQSAKEKKVNDELYALYQKGAVKVEYKLSPEINLYMAFIDEMQYYFIINKKGLVQINSMNEVKMYQEPVAA